MKYDAVIVGSGFGGACAAWRLVRAGLKTLLVERGGWPRRDERDWSQRGILIEKRYQSASPVSVRQYGAREAEPLHPNEVVGGNSVFFGGASLRLRETDFEKWPISYGELEPCYTEAEDLLAVHGQAGADPCEPPRSTDYPRAPVELAPPARRIRSAAERLGLKPFPLPMAINFDDPERPQCIRCSTCDGFPCRIEAKNDMTATALRLGQEAGLEIVAGLAATHLEVSGDRAEALHAVAVAGEPGTRRLEGERFFLAAGALHTPALLLRSRLDSPGARWIGRCLMRHCNGVVAGVFPFRTNPGNLFHKQLCFTEFYERFRARHGTAAGVIQDIYTPSGEVISHFAPFGLKRIAGAFSPFMQNLLCIAEDEPRFENAVRLSSGRDDWGVEVPRVDHEYSAADLERRDFLADQARRVLRAAGAWKTRFYEIDTFSHAVGTVRCAGSPEQGALDRDCRVWGIGNLHVVDGSCFPASGGVNPSLTIAANALRVADAVAGGAA